LKNQTRQVGGDFKNIVHLNGSTCSRSKGVSIGRGLLKKEVTPAKFATSTNARNSEEKEKLNLIGGANRTNGGLQKVDKEEK